MEKNGEENFLVILVSVHHRSMMVGERKRERKKERKKERNDGGGRQPRSSSLSFTINDSFLGRWKKEACFREKKKRERERRKKEKKERKRRERKERSNNPHLDFWD